MNFVFDDFAVISALLMSYILIDIIMPTVIGKWIGKKNLNILKDVKKCYLTFDDGPSEKLTPEILNILRKYQVKATFFVSGKAALRYPSLINTIIQDGHIIGEHGYEHLHGWKAGSFRTYRNLVNGEEAIKRVTGGKNILLLRPPYGKFNIGVLVYLAIRRKILILWNVDSKDYLFIDQKNILKNILEKKDNKNVILLHDGKPFGEPQKFCQSEIVAEVIREKKKKFISFECMEKFVPSRFGLGSIMF